MNRASLQISDISTPVTMANTKSSNEFSDYLMDITNKTMVAHGIALGSSLGIFDVMISLGEPHTYQEIAAFGHWKPRYIKEWLNLMVVGNIISYNKESQTYFISEERQLALATNGKSKNNSVMIEYLNIQGLVLNEVASCIQEDGPTGVPYSSFKGLNNWYSRFHSVTLTWEGGMKDILQLDPDLYQALERGVRVCDGGCGTGYKTRLMAQNLPRSSFLGFDFSEEAIVEANVKIKESNLSNITFKVCDARQLPKEWTDYFDVFVATNVVHDLLRPRDFLREILCVLKPGGIFLMLDKNLHTNVEDNVGTTHSQMEYGFSLFHCLPVALADGEGDGLGSTWGIEKQRDYLCEAGFANIKQLDVQDKSQSCFVCYK